ncbi:cobalamin ABC transporter substrate-binding protein [Polyangium spumosum]|uniref:Cobalamin ABC transporter substrate-binding protein n=1 Tax=Polyangium spumosum TaxID=889282 RepID=A0A6N7PSV3_9BACT|nr:cobalamin ABC transporter substrate-binding protein [Polyangium spumosum]MRG93460.1 cobalamin ABC transporter substrate-binding protein [Polyangium spumosum]
MPQLSTRTAKQALAVAFSAALGGLVSGCGAASVQGDANTTAYPTWTGHDQVLFDDVVDAGALGLGADVSRAQKDPLLRERARASELVSRVRVSTVTVESLAEVRTYRLVLQVVPPPFGSPAFEQTAFELVIGPSAPSYGVAKAFDMRLRGASFIGFLRRFAGAGDEPSKLHWHLSPDTAEVAAAVTDALALAELSGS